MLFSISAKRSYRSPLRREQAAATRERILDAAAGLLLARGYAATTLDQVAAAAGVAVPTLTGYFPAKVALLTEVLRWVVRGDEGEENRVPLGQQLTALLEITSPSELLAAVATLCRTANQRGFQLFEILRTAAAVEPRVEQQRREGAEARRRDQAPLARHLERRGVLRPELTVEEATDLLWLYSSADIYRLLVSDSDWSPQRYEKWLSRTLSEALLRPSKAKHQVKLGGRPAPRGNGN